MKKLIPLLLAILLAGCARTYDGPTETKPVLTEYTIDHYYSYFETEELHYTTRYLHAYDIYGNLVRSMEYRDGELISITKRKYDDRGNEISQSEWNYTGLLPAFQGRTEQTYDEQNRSTSYVYYNFWGSQEGGSWYTYDDENHIRYWKNGSGDTQTTWLDEEGRELRTVSGDSETVYHYDDRGNCIGWTGYQNGQPLDHYEARYDDRDRQIWGGYYDTGGNLLNQTSWEYDDERNTITCHRNDGGTRVEYYHADGRPHMVEDFDAEGRRTMLQRYYYQDILVPAKEEIP